MRKITLLILVFVSSSCFAQTNASVAQRRSAHLRHGINLSEWFAQVYDPKGYTKEHLETWVTADDIPLIKSMGFDHVRLSVNPEPMIRDYVRSGLLGLCLSPSWFGPSSQMPRHPTPSISTPRICSRTRVRRGAKTAATAKESWRIRRPWSRRRWSQLGNGTP